MPKVPVRPERAGWPWRFATTASWINAGSSFIHVPSEGNSRNRNRMRPRIRSALRSAEVQLLMLAGVLLDILFEFLNQTFFGRNHRLKVTKGVRGDFAQ